MATFPVLAVVQKRKREQRLKAIDSGLTLGYLWVMLLLFLFKAI